MEVLEYIVMNGLKMQIHNSWPHHTIVQISIFSEQILQHYAANMFLVQIKANDPESDNQFEKNSVCSMQVNSILHTASLPTSNVFKNLKYASIITVCLNIY